MAEGLALWEAILLGIVQGLTEWLPVSSSGHLVLAQVLVGVDAPLFFELTVHVATLLVVLAYYRHDLLRMTRAVAAWPRDAKRQGGYRASLDEPDRRLALLVVVGSVPTALIGFTMAGLVEHAFTSLAVVGTALVLTGTILWGTRLADQVPMRPLDGGRALVVGTLQGLAILPGISRSGTTIAGGLLLGLDREQAVRFSFLLAIPAILGATLLLVVEGQATSLAGNVAAHVVGFIAALVVGYASLVWLVRIARRGGLHHFAWYCWGVGAFALWLAFA